VMGLMEPTSNGIGGDLFALVYDAKTGTLHGLNASGWAPRALTPEFLRAAGVTELPSRGPYTVTVPGVVAGWHSMREKFGRLPMSDLLAPAIHYANEGFPVAEITAGLWARSLELLQAEPRASRTFLVDGRVPAAGSIFRNPDLARSLTRIAERCHGCGSVLVPRTFDQHQLDVDGAMLGPQDRGDAFRLPAGQVAAARADAQAIHRSPWESSVGSRSSGREDSSSPKSSRATSMRRRPLSPWAEASRRKWVGWCNSLLSRARVTCSTAARCSGAKCDVCRSTS